MVEYYCSFSNNSKPELCKMILTGNQTFASGGSKGEGKTICICLKHNVIHN